MFPHFKTLRDTLVSSKTRQNILKSITASKVIKEGGLLDPWSKAGIKGKIYLLIRCKSTVQVIEAGGLSSAQSQNARD